jgi:hypothetical protein
MKDFIYRPAMIFPKIDLHLYGHSKPIACELIYNILEVCFS